jgi:Polyketide cyclase / dehydrase and lipid transport
MAKASSSVELAVTADQVWKLIGGFGSLPDWLPYIPKSELAEGGRTRHLANPNGSTIIERLMAFDEKGRSYTYHILQSPFPVTDYYSTLKVTSAEGGKSSRVEWSGEFTPKGVSDQEASRIFQTIYGDGLKALARNFSK